VRWRAALSLMPMPQAVVKVVEPATPEHLDRAQFKIFEYYAGCSQAPQAAAAFFSA
jgi:hypothetical protein